jgi:hypothetical protein
LRRFYGVTSSSRYPLVGMAVEFRAPEKIGAALVKKNSTTLLNPSSFC